MSLKPRELSISKPLTKARASSSPLLATLPINTSAGWMGTSTVTTGNNVEAYLDTDANNAPDNNNGSGLSTRPCVVSHSGFHLPVFNYR